MVHPKIIVLTGAPGVGKTTLVQNALNAAKDSGLSVSGFYTMELREDGRRVGFDAVSTSDKRAPLARVRGFSRSTSCGPSVGQYSVTVGPFEELALTSLAIPADVVILDEVGKMELFSEPFKNRVRELIVKAENCILVTVPIAKGKPLPLVDQIKHHHSSVIFEVTRENRNRLLKEVLAAIHKALRK